MGNFCLLSCVVQILTNPLLYLLHRFFEKDIFSLLKKASLNRMFYPCYSSEKEFDLNILEHNLCSIIVVVISSTGV